MFEWELARCFNCFRDGHDVFRCCDPPRDLFQREALRERLGVINRHWTEYLLRFRAIAPEIKFKHQAFSRIWTPYWSGASGLPVSPHPIPVDPLSMTPPVETKDCGSQTEPTACADLAVQTDVDEPKHTTCSASQTDPPPPQPSVSHQAVQATPPPMTDQAAQATPPPMTDQAAQATPPPMTDQAAQATPPPMVDQAVEAPPPRLPSSSRPRRVSKPRRGAAAATRTPAPAPAPALEPTPEPTPPLPEDEGEGEESLITGKNHERCWMCTKVHSPMDPCEAASQFSNANSGWGEASWQEQLKAASLLYKPPSGTRASGGSRHRSRKASGLKTLAISNSRSVDANTTAYRVENGEKDIALGRADLTLLAKLDVEAARGADGRPPPYREPDGGAGVGASASGLACGAPLPIDHPLCHLNRCPNEILETIFTYAGDDYASGDGGKVKDIIAGHNFSLGDGVWDNIRRARNLDGVAKSCRRLRLVAQQIIYKVVCIDGYKPLRKFALALTADPELGELVQVFRITLCQTNQPYRNRGLFRYRMDRGTVVSNTDFASLFVRVVESCPNLQVLSAKMFGSVLGFGAIRGHFPKMREICISDPISSSLVLNRMWNHLVDFPQLTKFKIVHSELNNAVDFTPLEIPHHMADRALVNNFKHLATLTLENAPEVADGLLFFLARRLTALTKLAIVNCKLVSSAGACRLAVRPVCERPKQALTRV